MFRFWTSLALLFLLCTGVRAQTDAYAQQESVIVAMLEEGNHRAARAQARALVTSGQQAKLPVVEARGRYLLGRALSEGPAATAKSRVKGIREMRLAARTARRTRESALLADILASLEALTGNQSLEIEELPSVQALREQIPSGEEIDEAAIDAIVSLQDQEITALNDSQMRQMIRLQKQQQELDRYAFEALNDSLMLLNQQLLIDEQEAEVQRGLQQRNLFFVIAGAALAFLGLLYYRFRANKRYQEKLRASNEIIREERQRSEELLLNILPVTVAAELKETGKATARHYDDASVLFADFKGFSALAATLSPEVLVAYLDEAFRAFDEIVRKHGLEKIKTIGDAYMCAGGLPEEYPDHPVKMVTAALEMQRYLKSNPHFSARIGIHVGPVVAGVVGRDKFVYDIWGDTVNQASRLEVAGETGRVAISESVARRVKGKFKCIPAGTFTAKNIGEMKRFWVEG